MLGTMPSLLDNIRSAIAGPRGARPVCMACGRVVSPRDESLRVQGGSVVHRSCATYQLRRRRTGQERLGYPRRR
jgi:hypothetical protein